ncbi:hypothetical protein E2C01_051971 [Portunus trituberculatus]|uniref:Uncharacterized protein n=1 Tax=Portunus trituberculatus TaxID=210409 RepID=A0A5B7GK79_PORTR|nr:hypothetical protein [Portunus trituberculatus]
MSRYVTCAPFRDFIYCIMASEYPKNPSDKKFDKCRPKLVEGRDGFGAARREKVTVVSGLGPKARNWQQVLLFLRGLKPHYSHPLAAPHTRQGIAMKQGINVCPSLNRGSPKGVIRAPSIVWGRVCTGSLIVTHRAEQFAMNEATLCAMH